VKTLEELLIERRPIEVQLAAWLKEWDALCAAKGLEGSDCLRPIEKMLRERQ
jgi:hypothetical protein